MAAKTNKSVFLSALALVLMTGSGFLLGWTINTLSHSIETWLTFITVLVSVFLYVAGATWIGRILAQHGSEWKIGGFHNGIIFSLLAIGTGMLLLCLNRGILPVGWKYFFISWPMLLFVLGSCALCTVHYTPGIILAAVGTFFLVPRFATLFPGTSFDGQFLSVWWPVFIIIGGVLIFFSILFRPKHFCRVHPHRAKDYWKNHQVKQEENSDGKIDFKSIFSGMDQVILDPVLKGGTIEAVFGGVDLDLRKTSLREGETFLYVKAVFGGVEIKAPEDWHIEIRSESFCGGVTDDRHKSKDIDYSRKLILVAEAVFGGIAITTH